MHEHGTDGRSDADLSELYVPHDLFVRRGPKAAHLLAAGAGALAVALAIGSAAVWAGQTGDDLGPARSTAVSQDADGQPGPDGSGDGALLLAAPDRAVATDGSPTPAQAVAAPAASLVPAASAGAGGVAPASRPIPTAPPRPAGRAPEVAPAPPLLPVVSSPTTGSTQRPTPAPPAPSTPVAPVTKPAPAPVAPAPPPATAPVRPGPNVDRDDHDGRGDGRWDRDDDHDWRTGAAADRRGDDSDDDRDENDDRDDRDDDDRDGRHGADDD